jgi:hypothetical protein
MDPRLRGDDDEGARFWEGEAPAEPQEPLAYLFGILKLQGWHVPPSAGLPAVVWSVCSTEQCVSSKTRRACLPQAWESQPAPIVEPFP